MKLFYILYNPGIILQPGDVSIQFMSNQEAGKGTEYYFRDGELLYSVSLPDMKTHFDENYFTILENSSNQKRFDDGRVRCYL